MEQNNNFNCANIQVDNLKLNDVKKDNESLQDSDVYNMLEKKSSVLKTKKKRRKHRFFKMLLIVFIIFLLVKWNNEYKKTLDHIYITTSEIYGKKDDDNFYKINNKIDKIDLKVRTKKKVVSTKISHVSYNLVLFEEKYGDEKKWSLKNVSLPLGTSNLNISVTLETGETIERRIVLYNISKDNLGNLDIKDDDSDKLLNYQEEMYGTNKELLDSDFDGLNDYEELNYTNTNPMKYATYIENVRDADLDYDLDGLTNIEELQLKTNAIMSDTDSDGLSDGDEKIKGTNPLSFDTDNDGVSDYDEVVNFNSSPIFKTDVFSGKVESENREVGITLSNISSTDIKNVKFEKSGISFLNSSIVGYIMPAYDISTSIGFDSSDISFNFANYKIDSDCNPTIYYFNEKMHSLEELPTTVVGTVATTTVKHFSTYILVDKNKYENINNVTVDSGEIEVTEPIDGEFLIIYSPIAAKVVGLPIQIIASPDISAKQQVILREKFNLLFSNEYKFEVTSMKSAFGFNILKNIFDFVYGLLYDFTLSTSEQELDVLFSTSNISNKSYVNEVFGAFSLGYLNNVDDLGAYFVPADQDNIFKDNYILVDLDDKTDTNEDGINDSLTKAILSGVITTETGFNPFEGYTYEQINLSKDLDNDGLINGDEIKLSEKNGKYYIEMISNPVLVDSDFDGIIDSKDASPFISIVEGFSFGGKLDDDVDVSFYERERDQFNSLYGKGSLLDGDKMISYTDKNGESRVSFVMNDLEPSLMGAAAFLGGEYGAGDAAKAHSRYFERSGKTYTETDIVESTLTDGDKLNKDSLFGSDDVQARFRTNVSKVMKAAEDNIKNGNTQVIKSVNPFVAAGDIGDFSQNLNTFGFLHGASGHLISETTNNNDIYTMKLRYFILDIYDWKNECDLSNPACRIEVSYFNEMLLGKAKAFMVKIEYDVELVWKKGESPNVKILRGTPHA